MKSIKLFQEFLFSTFVAILCCVALGALACHSFIYYILQCNSVYNSTISMFLLRNRFKAHKDHGHSLFSWIAKKKVSRKKGRNLSFLLKIVFGW